MNVLLRPYTKEERIPDQLLLGLRSYNPNDGFGRVGGDQLNFAAPSEDEAEYPPGAYLKKGKVSRQDPMSHRIIEKRRRDRMNNCLADLSRLIPPEYLKKGRGRIEKTEIIEMAIRHLKYLQDRANAADQQSEGAFQAGYQEAVGEAVRFMVEVQGYEPGDGLCVALGTHLQRHVEVVTKGQSHLREQPSSHPGRSSSETSSSSSHGYTVKRGVIQVPPPAPPSFPEPYEPQQEPYAMDCDRVPVSMPEADGEILPERGVEPLALDARRKRSPTLRAVRKPEHMEDYLHSYKFKNSIERRFSRSQDSEAAELADVTRNSAAHGKLYKRRRGPRPSFPAPFSCNSTSTSTSTSASASTEEARDNSPQDTSSESAQASHQHYDKPAVPPQYVPVFALNEIGKYYVPLSVEYSCLMRHGGAGALAPRAAHLAPPLHPVAIHVNFHACLDCHVKREPADRADREWRPM